jgi:hypothetical protein
MGSCIYCRAETHGDEPLDHPIPQALGTGDYTLPPGDVCAGCNAYLGDLDRNLCEHHHFASMIVFGQLRGTDDRIRQSITGGFAFDAARQHLTIRAKAPTVEEGCLTVRDPGNVKFDEWKFSRGLHRVALGVLALQVGAEQALAPQYDAVRNYIRRPTARTEFWPYFQRPSDKLLGNRSFPIALAAQGFKMSMAIADIATYMYLNLFVSEFVVALHGELAALTQDHRRQLALAAGIEEPHSTRPWRHVTDARPGEEVRIDASFFADKLNPKPD